MQKMRDYFENVMNGALGEMRLGDKCIAEACGPCLIIATDDSGREVPMIGWFAMVSLEHDKIIGQPPICSIIPLKTIRPPDQAWQAAAKFLLEGCRDLRAQANNPGPPPGSQPPTQNIPEGLRGKPIPRIG